MRLQDFRPPRWLKPPRGYSNRTIHLYDRKDKTLCPNGLCQSVGDPPQDSDLTDLCMECWEVLLAATNKEKKT